MKPPYVSIRHFDTSTLRVQIEENDKTAPSRQLGYFDLSILRVQIGQNEKTVLIR